MMMMSDSISGAITVSNGDNDNDHHQQQQRASKKRKIDQHTSIPIGGGNGDVVRNKLDKVVRWLADLLCEKKAPAAKILPGSGDNVFHITLMDITREFEPFLLQRQLLKDYDLILASETSRLVFGQTGFSVNLMLVVMPRETYAVNCPKPTAEAVHENYNNQQTVETKHSSVIASNSNDPTLLVLRTLEEYIGGYMGKQTPAGISTVIYYPKEQEGPLQALFHAFLKGSPEMRELDKNAVVSPQLRDGSFFRIAIKGWKTANFVHFNTLHGLFPFLVEGVVVSPKTDSVYVLVRHALLPCLSRAIGFSPSMLML
jgi:hypothetical protein